VDQIKGIVLRRR